MKNHNPATAHATTPKDFLAHLNALVVEAERLVRDSPSEHTEGTMDSLRSRFDAAQQQVAGLYSGARKKIAFGAKYTDEAIRANPYRSLVIAAGVGLLFGVLLRRRSK